MIVMVKMMREDVQRQDFRKGEEEVQVLRRSKRWW